MGVGKGVSCFMNGIIYVTCGVPDDIGDNDDNKTTRFYTRPDKKRLMLMLMDGTWPHLPFHACTIFISAWQKWSSQFYMHKIADQNEWRKEKKTNAETENGDEQM